MLIIFGSFKFQVRKFIFSEMRNPINVATAS